jgi:hypothetical protein
MAELGGRAYAASRAIRPIAVEGYRSVLIPWQGVVRGQRVLVEALTKSK